MTVKCAYSLLDDPLFSIQTPEDARYEVSLPQVLQHLASDGVASFNALQPHQRQGWYSFLVQLAAIALARNGEQRLVTSAAQWKDLLLMLTNGDEHAWCLVVDDVSQPAFMQSPVPEGSLNEAAYKPDVVTPDDLDILVTSKNHDVKMHRIAHPKIEHWVYALITLQTMEGFLGQGNYGIARMNGGFGNRPLVGLSVDLSWGIRFQRDVGILLSARERLAEEYNYNLEGIALLWLLPWDGSSSGSLPLDSCDPLFIEICRRIRFTHAEGVLHCWKANTKSSRIAAPKDINGVIGDPWTPVDKESAKALTLDEQGFSYRKLHEILFSGKYAEPLALETTAAEKNGAFVSATALVRGQGKTGGWHNRVVPVPSKAIRLFASISQRQELAVRAQEQIDVATTVQNHILSPALYRLLAAGRNEKSASGKLGRWKEAYNADVDDVFFQYLWNSLNLTRDEARLRWQQRLFDFAHDQLEDAINSTPLPSARRYRAISAAESIFYGSAHKYLDKLFEDQKGKEENGDTTST